MKKKKLTLLVVLLSVAALTSCGGDNVSDSSSDVSESSSQDSIPFNEAELNQGLASINKSLSLEEYIFINLPNSESQDMIYTTVKKYSETAYSEASTYTIPYDERVLPQSEIVYGENSVGRLTQYYLGLDNVVHSTSSSELDFQDSIFSNIFNSLDSSYFTISAAGYDLASWSTAQYFLGYLSGFTVVRDYELEDGTLYTRTFDIDSFTFTIKNGSVTAISASALMNISQKLGTQVSTTQYTFDALYSVYDQNNTIVDIPTAIVDDGKDRSALETAFTKLGNNYTANIEVNYATVNNNVATETYIEKYTDDGIYFDVNGETVSSDNQNFDAFKQFSNLSTIIFDKSTYEEFSSLYGVEDNDDNPYLEAEFYTINENFPNTSELLREMFYPFYSELDGYDYFEFLYDFYLVVFPDGELEVLFSAIQAQEYSELYYYSYPVVSITYSDIGSTQL